MNPSLIIALTVIAGTLGSVGYAYVVGKDQGQQVCEAEKLQAELVKSQKELEIQKQLSEFQQEQIGEAQSHIDQEKLKSANLQKYIDNMPSDSNWCISPGVLEELRKFRYGAKDKNS